MIDERKNKKKMARESDGWTDKESRETEIEQRRGEAREMVRQTKSQERDGQKETRKRL